MMHLKLKPLLLGTVFLLISCKDKFAKVPSDIIPEDKMVSIYADLHQQEARILNKKLSMDSCALAYKVLKLRILKKRGYDTVQFKKSEKFYIEHPNNYDRVYKAVVDTLALREQRKILTIY